MKKIRQSFLKPFLLICFGLLIAATTIANPFDAPDKPINPKVIDIIKNGCTLTWGSPASDGGSAILYYIVEGRKKDGDWIEITKVPGNLLICNINNQTEGVEKQLRIIAVNKAGRSKPSEPTDFITFIGSR